MRAILERFGKREALLAAGCLVSGFVFSLLSPYFASVDNLLTIARNSTELLLIGLGMTLLLGVGGIDVSVGSLLGLAAIVIGRLLEAGTPPALAALAGPLAGVALGLVTGLTVVFGRIPAIVATLGMLGVYRAAIFLALGGSWLSGLPVGLTNLLSTRIFGAPVSLLVIALAYAAVFVAIRLTPFGAHLTGDRQFRGEGAARGDWRAPSPGRRLHHQRRALRPCRELLRGDLSQCGDDRRRHARARSDRCCGSWRDGGDGRPRKPSRHGRSASYLLRLLQNGLLLIGVPSLWQPVVTGVLLLAVLGAEAVSGRLSLGRLGSSVLLRTSAR